MKKTKTASQDERALAVINGRDEMNLCEFPFASLRSRGDSRKAIVYEGWITDKNGNRLQQKWIAQGGSLVGIPTEFDERVYVALMALANQQKFESRKVIFSVYRVLKIMGLPTNTKLYYRSVEDSLKRLRGVSFTAEGAFWDNEKKELVREVLGFGLVDEYWLRYKEKDKKIREEKGVPAYILWNERIWNNIKASYIKFLDAGFFFSLKSPLARRLYRLLDKRLYNKSEYTFDIFDLSGKLGMVRYAKPTWVKRKLQPAIDELIARGFLSRVTFPKHNGYSRIHFVKAAAIAKPTSKKLALLWDKALEQLQQQLSIATFKTWFQRTKLLSLDGGVATIGVTKPHEQEWLSKRYAERIRATLAQVLGQEITDVRVEVIPDKKEPE